MLSKPDSTVSCTVCLILRCKLTWDWLMDTNKLPQFTRVFGYPMPNCSNIWHDPAIRTIALTVVDLVTIRIFTNTEYLSAVSPLVTLVYAQLKSIIVSWRIFSNLDLKCSTTNYKYWLQTNNYQRSFLTGHIKNSVFTS